MNQVDGKRENLNQTRNRYRASLLGHVGAFGMSVASALGYAEAPEIGLPSSLRVHIRNSAKWALGPTV